MKKILPILLSTILISAMHLGVKLVSGIPIEEVILFRALLSLSLCYMILRKKKVSLSVKPASPFLLRGLLGTLSILTFFYTLRHIPLASAVTISNLSPVFLLIFGALFLKEPFRLYHLLILCLCFSGVLIMKGIDSGIDGSDLVIAVSATLFSTLAHLSIRYFPKETDPWLILFYFTLFTIPCVTPLVILHWKLPTLEEAMILAAISLCSHFGQYFLTKAYQTLALTTIAPFHFLGIALSIFYGITVLQEHLSSRTVAGILLISAGLCIYFFKKRKEKIAL